MGKEVLTLIGSLIAAVIGVAIVAVIFSPNAQTTSVVSSAFSGLGNLIGVAVSPVTQNYSGSGASGFGQFTSTSNSIGDVLNTGGINI